MSRPVPPPRRRGGCLGCLGTLIGLVVLGVVLIAAGDFAFAPWIYSVGGRTRLLPVWTGEGEAQGPGGTYRLYVTFSPTPAKQHILPETAIQGTGRLCTPKGVAYFMQVRGGTHPVIWRDMDGHAFDLRIYHRPIFFTVTGGPFTPSIQLTGRWVGPNLVMSDEGSFAHEFLPDGQLSPNAGKGYPKTGGTPVTLTEHPYEFFAPKC